VRTGRRQLLHFAGAIALGACKKESPAPVPSGPIRVHGKAPDLILLTDRPPNVETPLHHFKHDLTPNDAFFVRWHLGVLPGPIDLRTYRLKIEGAVDKKLELSLDDIKKMTAMEVVAVNQCAGNGRGHFSPPVAGLQWKNGAMGNARWRGVRLKEVLQGAGLFARTKDVVFSGLDAPPIGTVPDFAKSLTIEHALSDHVILAYEMNGQPLPLHNGFPLRLVVPGYYSTYWVKALDRIEVRADAFDGFWMSKAYRIAPSGRESPDDLAKETVPVTRMNVRSFVVKPAPGDTIPDGKPCEVEGIAFDGGSGIAKVDVSLDGGATWTEARLDAEIGRYSFRRFRYVFTPAGKGPKRILVRAMNNDKDVQPEIAAWNRAGYMRNMIESTEVTVT
jgi:DMSO/TMAO reductase YedYZ molybdopterin-dependent catalytic subunit